MPFIRQRQNTNILASSSATRGGGASSTNLMSNGRIIMSNFGMRGGRPKMSSASVRAKIEEDIMSKAISEGRGPYSTKNAS